MPVPQTNNRQANNGPSCDGVFKHPLITRELEQVVRFIQAHFRDCPVPEEIQPLLQQGLAVQGKMLRPALVLLAGHACARVTPEHISTAAVMEMIHAATLFHDDVIDQGDLRRGCATVNDQWGNAPAILLGDWVLARVLRICVDLPPAIRRLIADMAARICQGELRQTLHKQGMPREAQYLDIIRDKTASFFEECCRAGVLLATQDSVAIKALSEYGRHMGMAFQLTDDLLDLEGHERQTGKAAGNDLANHRLTLGVIHLLHHMGPQDRTTLIRQLEQGTVTSMSLQALLTQHGSVDYVREHVRRYIQQATTSLGPLADTEAGGILIDIANGLDGRKK